MADVKISALTAVVTPATTDEFPVNQGGTSKKMTLIQLLNSERYLLRQDAGRTLTSTTVAQALFEAAWDTLTLPLGTYRLEAYIWLQGMSATSGNFSFGVLGAGTAVVSTVKYHACGIDATSPQNVAAQSGLFSNVSASAASIAVAATGTEAATHIMGMFEVTTAGTIIPSVELVTAAAATVALGTYFLAERISTSVALTSIGPAS